MIPGVCDTTTDKSTATTTTITPATTTMMNSRAMNKKNTSTIQVIGGTINHQQQHGLMCSQQSILTAMERFVRSMNNMDATVLVPSKLRDMDNIGLKTERHIIPSTFSNIANQTNELHNFFIMLNDVKKELLWGCSTSSTITSMAQSSSPISSSSSSTSHEFVYNNHRRNSTINNNTILFNRSISVQSSLTNQSIINNHNNSSILAINKQHSRQSSQEDCLGSIGSSVSSSSDTESDADSMLTDSIEDSTSHLFVSFRHHLQGLHSILNQLADSADFLSVRYQEEIGDI